MAERTGLPPYAAWRHTGARDGFEVAFFQQLGSGLIVQGHTAAVEDGEGFVVRYRIELDEFGCTRSAHVSSRTAAGFSEALIESNGEGVWEIDGKRREELDGCLDLDLESSSLTNAFPVRRIEPEIGDELDCPAAWVRATDAAVERLEQDYRRLDDREEGRQRFHYRAPAFDFESELVYDASGLILAYPGIAERADG
ncbi:MAG: putative glycolipid-binding domain-containing protein [Solirubrobacteraceae bacterium]|nr:putative glycolipid-binding domain-containing protein [Solirubrobacteraceae bacterium]